MPNDSSALKALGAVLAAIRKRSGKSQAAIAFRGGCGQPHVSRTERGERKPTPELFSVYCNLALKDLDMHRRLLFTAASAGLAATLLPEAALAQRLDEGLTADLDYWDARVLELGRDHMQTGAIAMRPKLVNTLQELASVNGSGQLTHHIARLAVLYARAQDSLTEARTYYNLARHYADRSGDRGTIAWVNGRIALGMCDTPSTSPEHETYAQAALAQGDPVDFLGGLGMYLVHHARARAAAVQGEDDAALAHLEHSRHAYDAVDPDISGTEWSYDAARFCTDNSYVLQAIGRGAEAQSWADQAQQEGVSGRFVTHLQLHPLVGRYRAGDCTAADEARQLMAALDPTQQSMTLRHVAAQAGAREYLMAA